MRALLSILKGKTTSQREAKREQGQEKKLKRGLGRGDWDSRRDCKGEDAGCSKMFVSQGYATDGGSTQPNT
eukprot:1109082-Amorphochlora_amoeboformis.AAC.1